MDRDRVNRISRRSLLLFSVVALLMVLSGFMQPAQADEGTAAYIFQLSVVAFALALCAFLVSADWKGPSRSVCSLAFPGSVLAVAFATLYYLEHIRG